MMTGRVTHYLAYGQNRTACGRGVGEFIKWSLHTQGARIYKAANVDQRLEVLDDENRVGCMKCRKALED